MHIQSLVMCASKEPKIYWSYHPIACMLSRFRCVQLFATLGTIACQAPLSVGFSRQDFWSGLPCPPPGDLPNPEIEPLTPALQADSLPLSHWRNPLTNT